MHTALTDHELPDRDLVVWRYFGIAEWLSLLTTSELFFSRLDLLGDNFEGYFPVLENQHSKVLHHFAWAWRYHWYVNCWTIADGESMVMWRLYASSTEGVAVRTTVGRILDALDADPKRMCIVAPVTYVDDHEQCDVSDMSQLAFLKRRAFSYENELRIAFLGVTSREENGETVLTTEPDRIQPGESIPIQPRSLFDEVRIAPESPQWIRQTMIETTTRFAPKLSVELS